MRPIPYRYDKVARVYKASFADQVEGALLINCLTSVIKVVNGAPFLGNFNLSRMNGAFEMCSFNEVEKNSSQTYTKVHRIATLESIYTDLFKRRRSKNLKLLASQMTSRNSRLCPLNQGLYRNNLNQSMPAPTQDSLEVGRNVQRGPRPGRRIQLDTWQIGLRLRYRIIKVPVKCR